MECISVGDRSLMTLQSTRRLLEKGLELPAELDKKGFGNAHTS